MRVLADTSALIALIDPADRHNIWAASRWKEMEHPVHTCEAVLSETLHLLRKVPAGRSVLLEMWHCGAVVVDFPLSTQGAAVRALISKYQSVPMSLADACLVRMCELMADGRVWTLDADFRIYRRHGRQVIPVLMPEKLP